MKIPYNINDNKAAIGILSIIAAYFDPIKGIIHLMIVSIIIDLITGIIASRMQGNGIQSLRLWRTIYKLFYSVTVVMIIYGMDKELGMIEIHRYVAWIIISFEIWSIMENAAKITDHKIFRIIKVFMEDKIKDTTGINFKDDE